MMVVVRRLSLAKGLFAAYCAGIMYAVGIAPFVYETLRDHYQVNIVNSILFTVLILGGVMGFFFTAPIMIWRIIVGKLNPEVSGNQKLINGFTRCLLAASIFFFFELLRSSGIFSLPWGLFGAGLAELSHFIQVADIIGVLGLSFVVILISALAYEIIEIFIGYWQRRNTRELVPAGYFATLGASLVLVIMIYGVVAENHWAKEIQQHQTNANTPRLNVALVQSNIPHSRRWRSENVDENVNTHLELSRLVLSAPSKPQLIVWPESSVNLYLRQSGTSQQRIRRLAGENGNYLLLGAPDFTNINNKINYYNAAYLVDNVGSINGQYNKIQLLPFAEYNPLGELGLLPQIGDSPRVYSPGAEPTVFSINVNTNSGAEKVQFMIAPLICYEGLYPWLARAVVAQGAQLLVNISNDQLFNGPVASEQHSSQTRFRAIETRRYYVRNALTGISLIYNPLGKIHDNKRLEVNQRGTLVASVPLLNGQTFYVRFGNGPLIGISVLVLAFGLYRFKLKHLSN